MIRHIYSTYNYYFSNFIVIIETVNKIFTMDYHTIYHGNILCSDWSIFVISLEYYIQQFYISTSVKGGWYPSKNCSLPGLVLKGDYRHPGESQQITTFDSTLFT